LPKQKTKPKRRDLYNVALSSDDDDDDADADADARTNFDVVAAALHAKQKRRRGASEKNKKKRARTPVGPARTHGTPSMAASASRSQSLVPTTAVTRLSPNSRGSSASVWKNLCATHLDGRTYRCSLCHKQLLLHKVTILISSHRNVMIINVFFSIFCRAEPVRTSSLTTQAYIRPFVLIFKLN